VRPGQFFFLFSLSLNDIVFCHLKCQNTKDWRQKKNETINLINVTLCLWNSAKEQRTSDHWSLRKRFESPTWCGATLPSTCYLTIPHHNTFTATTTVTGLSPSRFVTVTISYILLYIYIYIMTIGFSFVVFYDPQPMFVIIIIIIIKNWKRGKEKERLTWSCYLKTKVMVMEGWLTNVTFFPSTSVFRSLHLCYCFSLLVFFLFIFLFLLFPLSLSVLVPLSLSLYYLC